MKQVGIDKRSIQATGGKFVSYKTNVPLEGNRAFARLVDC